MTAQTNPRAAAAASLLAWEKQGRYANLEVSASLADSPLAGADRALYTALVYGVIERLLTLDYLIRRYARRSPSSLDREIRAALRLGLYQLTYMDRIPPHAAVSESVNLVPPRGRSFVNAVLRAHQRAGCRLVLPADDPLHAMSVEFSAPEPLCQFFIDRFGEAETRQLLAAFLERQPVTLRVNTLRTTLAAALASLPGAAVSPYDAEMLCVDHAASVAAGISDGLYFVQDPASRMAVRALGPQPGETVIDTCAAPGGKSFSAALDMENRGRLFSFDLHENKLSLIRRTAAALGISILTAAARDAREPDPALVGRADRVLCDAPCSGLGVIGKKPDVKYKPLDGAAALPAIQYDILCGAAQYVRPGGVLVYSTCTLNPDENEGVVDRFLAAHPDFAPEDFSLGALGASADGRRTLTPHRDGTDGFFIARMRRRDGGAPV